MLTFSLTFALAGPPLPTWTASDVELTGDPDTPSPTTLTSTPSVTADDAVVVTGAEPPSPHGWADERALLLSISGDLNTAYYILGTARGEGMVAHWRQGPMLGEGLSVEVPLELPADLRRPPTGPGAFG